MKETEDALRSAARTHQMGMVVTESGLLARAANELQRKWQDEAGRLFGYRLRCLRNQDEVARALAEIDRILTAGNDIIVTVQQRAE